MKSHVAFQLAYLYLRVAHSKGQGQGHAHFAFNILQTVTDRANIAIGNKHGYGLSIGLFTNDFSPLPRSKSRSRTFRLRMSLRG